MTHVLDAARLGQMVRTHVLETWFPRCIDDEHGGYLCDFDHRWRPAGDQVKMLEFQARQTRVAALGVRLDPSDAEMRAACLHGWEALRDGLWDAEHGGWYACADRAWSPMHGEKHAHGTAYAILACLDVGRVLDIPEAVEPGPRVVRVARRQCVGRDARGLLGLDAARRATARRGAGQGAAEARPPRPSRDAQKRERRRRHGENARAAQRACPLVTVGRAAGSPGGALRGVAGVNGRPADHLQCGPDVGRGASARRVRDPGELAAARRPGRAGQAPDGPRRGPRLPRVGRRHPRPPRLRHGQRP